MKTYRFIAITVLAAVLAAGCGKDDSLGNIFRLTANPMDNGGAKVLVTPSTLGSSWIVGEVINLNGNAYAIQEKNTGKFTIECLSSPSAPLYAIYPNTVEADGNNIDVSYSAGASTMTLRQLAVDYTDSSHATHKVVFPMAAYLEEVDNDQLLFDHLTAGMRFTIENTTGVACTLSSVRIYLYDDEAPTATGKNGVTVSWEHQGPIVPGGTIGGTTSDVTAEYASEMRFAMKTGGDDNVVIAAGGSISFCVPVTVRSITSFAVSGYKPDGSELFCRQKDLDSKKTLALNRMYNMPTITIN